MNVTHTRNNVMNSSMIINDMAEIKKKAEAFDEIDDLIVNGTLKDREPDAIFQNICHVIINFKERADNER